MTKCDVSEKHSVAGIAVVDNLVFIGRRVNVGQMGNRWEFPGGKVEVGESLQEALIREFTEEFNVHITVGRKITESVFTHNNLPVHLHAFEVFFPDIEINWILTEHSEVKWVSFNDIEKLDFVDSDLLIYNSIKSFFKNKDLSDQ